MTEKESVRKDSKRKADLHQEIDELQEVFSKNKDEKSLEKTISIKKFLQQNLEESVYSMITDIIKKLKRKAKCIQQNKREEITEPIMIVSSDEEAEGHSVTKENGLTVGNGESKDISKKSITKEPKKAIGDDVILIVSKKECLVNEEKEEGEIDEEIVEHDSEILKPYIDEKESRLRKEIEVNNDFQGDTGYDLTQKEVPAEKESIQPDRKHSKDISPSMSPLIFSDDSEKSIFSNEKRQKIVKMLNRNCPCSSITSAKEENFKEMGINRAFYSKESLSDDQLSAMMNHLLGDTSSEEYCPVPQAQRRRKHKRHRHRYKKDETVAEGDPEHERDIRRKHFRSSRDRSENLSKEKHYSSKSKSHRRNCNERECTRNSPFDHTSRESDSTKSYLHMRSSIDSKTELSRRLKSDHKSLSKSTDRKGDKKSTELQMEVINVDASDCESDNRNENLIIIDDDDDDDGQSVSIENLPLEPKLPFKYKPELDENKAKLILNDIPVNFEIDFQRSSREKCENKLESDKPIPEEKGLMESQSACKEVQNDNASEEDQKLIPSVASQSPTTEEKQLHSPPSSVTAVLSNKEHDRELALELNKLPEQDCPIEEQSTTRSKEEIESNIDVLIKKYKTKSLSELMEIKNKILGNVDNFNSSERTNIEQIINHALNAVRANNANQLEVSNEQSNLNQESSYNMSPSTLQTNNNYLPGVYTDNRIFNYPVNHFPPKRNVNDPRLCNRLRIASTKSTSELEKVKESPKPVNTSLVPNIKNTAESYNIAEQIAEEINANIGTVGSSAEKEKQAELNVKKNGKDNEKRIHSFDDYNKIKSKIKERRKSIESVYYRKNLQCEFKTYVPREKIGETEPGPKKEKKTSSENKSSNSSADNDNSTSFNMNVIKDVNTSTTLKSSKFNSSYPLGDLDASDSGVLKDVVPSKQVRKKGKKKRERSKSVCITRKEKITNKSDENLVVIQSNETSSNSIKANSNVESVKSVCGIKGNRELNNLYADISDSFIGREIFHNLETYERRKCNIEAQKRIEENASIANKRKQSSDSDSSENKPHKGIKGLKRNRKRKNTPSLPEEDDGEETEEFTEECAVVKKKKVDSMSTKSKVVKTPVISLEKLNVKEGDVVSISTMQRNEKNALLQPLKIVPYQNEASKRKSSKKRSCPILKNINRSHTFQKAISAASQTCLLCKHQSKSLVSHYVNEHDSEVYHSRLSVDQIEHFQEHLIEAKEYKPNKFKADCIFCERTIEDHFIDFYDHYSAHTGEFAYFCSNCQLKASSKETINIHCKTECQEKGSKREVNYCYDPETTEIKGYICKRCNYIQLNKANIEKHFRTEHCVQTWQQDEILELVLIKKPISSTPNVDSVMDEIPVANEPLKLLNIKAEPECGSVQNNVRISYEESPPVKNEMTIEETELREMPLTNNETADKQKTKEVKPVNSMTIINKDLCLNISSNGKDLIDNLLEGYGKRLNNKVKQEKDEVPCLQEVLNEPLQEKEKPSEPPKEQLTSSFSSSINFTNIITTKENNEISVTQVKNEITQGEKNNNDIIHTNISTNPCNENSPVLQENNTNVDNRNNSIDNSVKLPSKDMEVSFSSNETSTSTVATDNNQNITTTPIFSVQCDPCLHKSDNTNDLKTHTEINHNSGTTTTTSTSISAQPPPSVVSSEVAVSDVPTEKNKNCSLIRLVPTAKLLREDILHNEQLQSNKKEDLASNGQMSLEGLVNLVISNSLTRQPVSFSTPSTSVQSSQMNLSQPYKNLPSTTTSIAKSPGSYCDFVTAPQGGTSITKTNPGQTRINLGLYSGVLTNQRQLQQPNVQCGAAMSNQQSAATCSTNSIIESSQFIFICCGSNCSNKYFNLNELINHYSTSHPQISFQFTVTKPVRCLYCNLIISLLDIRSHHIEKHCEVNFIGFCNVSNNLQCFECNFQISTELLTEVARKNELLCHIYNEHRNLMYNNDLLLNSFLNNNLLNKFVNCGIQTNSYRCNFCINIYRSKVDAYEHVKKNHSEQISNDELRNGTLSLTKLFTECKYGKILYGCLKCYILFEKERNALQHIRIAHIKPFSCKICSTLTTDWTSMLTHFQTLHSHITALNSYIEYNDNNNHEYYYNVILTFPKGYTIPRNNINKILGINEDTKFREFIKTVNEEFRWR